MTPGRPRPALVVLIGLISGLVCWAAYRLPPPSTSDFETYWIGANALLAGEDPYTVVAGTATRYPLFYPLTTIVLTVPFAPLPFPVASVLWAVVSGSVFAWAAFRYGRGLPVALLSANFLNAVVQGQWSPLLVAAVIVPPISFVLAAKPSIGAALFVAFPARATAIAGAVLVALSVVVMPTWPLRWAESLQVPFHVPPVARPGGFLLLLALLRWRTPEGRLLAALACIPQSIGLYDTLPLFLIPRTRWQGYALAGLSYAAAFAQVGFVPRGPSMSLEATFEGRAPFIMLFLYLPALWMVLFPQPGDARRALRAARARLSV